VTTSGAPGVMCGFRHAIRDSPHVICGRLWLYYCVLHPRIVQQLHLHEQ
jgi:hypothetical protein